jgi:hypothetical protein
VVAAVTLVLLAAVALASCASLPARRAAGADVSRSHQHPSAPAATKARAAGSAGEATTAAAAAAARVADLLAADGGASCAGVPTTQTMTGAVSGCVRIPAVSPGPYHLVVEQVLVEPAAPPAKAAYGGGAVPPPRARAGAPEPPVHLSVITRHPRPGGDLVILGTVTGARPPGASPPNLCLDGCTGGLVYDGVPVQWTSRTRFMLHIVLPATGWLAASPDRVRTLQPGDNTVSLTCLAPERGCAGTPPEGSATFRLPATPTRCAAGQPCSVLAADPAVATPGRVVGVAGFAPLLSVIGSDEPFVYQLALLPGPGPGSGEATRFVGNPRQGVLKLDASTVALGAAAVTVAPAPSLASLGVLHPLVTTADGPSGAGPVTPDPTDPSAVAWCGSGSLSVASTGSGPALSVPTGAAGAALEALGTPGPAGIPPQCVAAVPLGPASDPAGVVAAAFPTLPADQSAMVADVALSTSNGGRSWTPLPVPAGASPDGFGGFRVDSGTVLALYSPSTAQPAAAPLVEAEHAPGTAWVPSQLSCPADGPCVTFSAYQPGACAMNGTLQGLLFSLDGGQTWATPSWPAAVDACSRAELVATSPRSELLLDPGSAFPVRRSVDGGTSWSALSVPSLPGVTPGTAPTPGDGSLLLLPDGSLLLTGEHGSSSAWELLRPDATRWCSVTNAPSGAAAATAFAPVELLDGQLWWLPGRPGTGQQDAQHAAADALRC